MSTKNNGMGQRSWPDRTFWIPLQSPSATTKALADEAEEWQASGHKSHLRIFATPFLIEFKRPGEEPTPLQWDTIKHLRAAGYDVEVHDSKESAIAAIQKRLPTGQRMTK